MAGTSVSLSGRFRQKWNNGDAAAKLSVVADADGPFGKTPLHPMAKELSQRITVAEKDFTTTLVAQDLSQPRVTKVLRRGEYNNPVGEPVEPGGLSVMGGLPGNAPKNRMGLARWLTSRDHPLVARVLVNRIWQRVFGYGLVRTPEDFGVQGQHPTHPQLLDWLAVELQDSGWDLKHMLRLMVQTRTFQQSFGVATGDERSGKPPVCPGIQLSHGRRNAARHRPFGQRPARHSYGR